MRIFQDVRFALRLVVKRPGFAVVAILTLALGVGAATSIFTVVEAVLLRPLPFADPDGLLHLHIRGSDGDLYPLPDADFVAWREHSEVFSSVAVYDTGQGLALTGEGEPERIVVVNVTDRFFTTVGVAPLIGRVFQPGEDRPDAPPAIVLSYPFWQRRFHGDPGVIGRVVRLNGASHTIVGVMPATFAFPDADLDGWRTLTMRPPVRRGPFYTWGIGRLRSGVTVPEARANVGAFESTIKQQYPGPQDWRYSLVPLHEQIVGDVRRVLYLLFGAVGFLLLIATANVANLLLARAGSRSREIAVRTAIGAARGRIIGQLMTESLVLGLLGSAAGLLIAVSATRGLLALAPQGLPRLNEVGLNVPVFAFAVGVASLCAVAFGLVPALRASRLPLVASLKEGGAGGAGAQQRRLQRTLVVVEIALAMVLSVAAGLMIRSMSALARVNPGFVPAQLLTFQLNLSQTRYDTPAKVTAFYEQLRHRLQSRPGVQSVGYSVSLPPDLNSMTDNFLAEGQVLAPNQSAPVAPLLFVDDNYFTTLGVPLVGGRFFDERDAPGSPEAVIVNETLAQRYYPNGAVGRRLKEGGTERPNNPWMTIVGVVGDVKYSGLDRPREPAYYLSYRQFPQRRLFVVVRTASDPKAMSTSIRSAIADVDKDIPMTRLRTVDELMAASIAAPRFRTTLLTTFAAVGLALAGIGIYGLMAYTVSERARELGVRVALGATTGDVMRMVLAEALILATSGIAVGVVGALAATRVMAALLFGIAPTDPATFTSIAGVLLATALLGSFVPARRAARIDPMVSLRSE